MRTPSITRCALRISTAEGCWAVVWFVLTSGAFFTGYALMLGANDFQLGLLAAIPLLSQVFQIPGAWFIEKTGWRKGVVGWTSLLSRLLWLPIALLPFLPLADRMRAFMMVYMVSSIAMNLAAPGWVAWMSAIVPQAIRGRYFGMRNRINGFVGIVATLAAGFAVDFFRQRGLERDGYLLLQGLAVVTGLAAFRLILRQPDPGYRAEPIPPLLRYLAQPMRDGNFVRLLVFNLYWLFAVSIAAPFFNAHLIKTMHWNFKSLALIGTLFSLATMVFHPMWGKLVDRYGHKPVLMISTLGIVHLPFYYAFCPWDVAWPIYVNAWLGGIFWSGFGLASFNLLIHMLPSAGRSVYVAVFSALNGIMTFLACTLSGWMAVQLEGVRWEFFGMTFVNYQVLFIITGLLRVPGILLLRRIQEPEASGTGLVIRRMFLEVNKRMGIGRHVFPYP